MSTIICPTILASSADEFKQQIERIKPFAKRIQIDIKDGDFAPGASLPLEQIWWPKGVVSDIHMMYLNPQEYIETLIKLKPNMVIVHAESNCDILKFAAILRDADIKTGVCILQQTTISETAYVLPHIQHLLIFSGDLGHFGGQADLSLISKITEAKTINENLEIGWDGGVNADNAAQLAKAGVDVFNVGGAIQNADDPEAAYATIVSRLNS